MSSFKAISSFVPEKKTFKGFKHLCAWRPCWSRDLDHVIKLWSLSVRRLNIKFGYSWPYGLWEKVWDCHTMRVKCQRLILISCINLYELVKTTVFYHFRKKFLRNLIFLHFSIFELAVNMPKSIKCITWKNKMIILE